MVPLTGFAPARPKTLAPEASASAVPPQRYMVARAGVAPAVFGLWGQRGNCFSPAQYMVPTQGNAPRQS